MSDLIQRLIDERIDLEEKLDKLDLFLMSEKADQIEKIQLALLKIQAAAMSTYLQCLIERLNYLN